MHEHSYLLPIAHWSKFFFLNKDTLAQDSK